MNQLFVLGVQLRLVIEGNTHGVNEVIDGLAGLGQTERSRADVLGLWIVESDPFGLSVLLNHTLAFDWFRAIVVRGIVNLHHLALTIKGRLGYGARKRHFSDVDVQIIKHLLDVTILWHQMCISLDPELPSPRIDIKPMSCSARHPIELIGQILDSDQKLFVSSSASGNLEGAGRLEEFVCDEASISIGLPLWPGGVPLGKSSLGSLFSRWEEVLPRRRLLPLWHLDSLISFFLQLLDLSSRPFGLSLNVGELGLLGQLLVHVREQTVVKGKVGGESGVEVVWDDVLCGKVLQKRLVKLPLERPLLRPLLNTVLVSGIRDLEVVSGRYLNSSAVLVELIQTALLEQVLLVHLRASLVDYLDVSLVP